ncbi:MAG: lipoprotein signal peptidase [Bacteroidota bacterium]
MRKYIPYLRPVFVVFLVLFIDQTVKFWIKTHMYLGQEFSVFGNWFIIHFTENPGMAFGFQFGGGYGKLTLSVLRIVAVGLISWYIFDSIKKGAKTGFIVCASLVLAGAMGNIIDSAFYGLIFNDSLFQVAQFMPEGGGYGTFLHGKVVDMFYFPILNGTFPTWLPFWGGEEFQFFRPVFNIADASISIGVVITFIFQKKFFPPKEKEKVESPEHIEEIS